MSYHAKITVFFDHDLNWWSVSLTLRSGQIVEEQLCCSPDVDLCDAVDQAIHDLDAGDLTHDDFALIQKERVAIWSPSDWPDGAT